MARRSRAVVETVKAKFRVWRIAIYIRLSKEDARCGRRYFRHNG